MGTGNAPPGIPDFYPDFAALTSGYQEDLFFYKLKFNLQMEQLLNFLTLQEIMVLMKMIRVHLEKLYVFPSIQKNEELLY